MDTDTKARGPGLEEMALARQSARVTARKLQLDLGRWFDEIDRTGAFREMAHASIGEFGEHQGFSALETRTMIRAARATALDPRIELFLLEGRISLEAAALLLKALTLPAKEGIVPPDWVERARVVPTRRLGEDIAAFAAKARHAQPPTRVVAWFSPEGMKKLRRVRRLVRRAEKSTTELTDADVIVRLAEFYLKKNDRLARRGRRRRLPHTAGLAGRYVAAETRRTIEVRDEERCVVGLCPNDVWLHAGHVEAHRDGGDREKGNLTCLCSGHNRMCETGDLVLRGTADDLVCLDSRGRVVLRSRDPMKRRPTFEEWKASRPHAA
jgi:hypothetical protein